MPALPAFEAKTILAPSVFAAPAMPVIAKPERLAAAEPPATVAPATIPVEARTVGLPASIGTPPAIKPSPLPAMAVTAPAAPEADSRLVIASAAPPPVDASEPAADATQHKQAVLAAVPAVPPVLPKRAALPAVAKLAERAPKSATIKPVRMAVASPMAKPVSPVAHPAALPTSLVANAPEKKIAVAVLHPKSDPPAKPSAFRAIIMALAALPARFFGPAPAKQAVPVVKTAVKVESAKAVSVAVAPVPAKVGLLESAEPVVAAANPGAKKFLTIGQPVKLQNASGKAGGTAPALRRLAVLGWTMRPSDARAQPATVLYYSAQNIAAAKALQRTLPFPVRLAVDKADAAGMRLVIGRDYLSWKPRNGHIAAQWQKGTITALLQKASSRGER
jgi:hypothetical protein